MSDKSEETAEVAVLKPCVKCLDGKPFRHRAGERRAWCIIQCGDCGFNVSAPSFQEAVRIWNGFKVWLVIGNPALPLAIAALAGHEAEIRAKSCSGAFAFHQRTCNLCSALMAVRACAQ